MTIPNQQRTLNKPPTELQCKNFFENKYRLSMQIGAKRAKTCMQCVPIPTELPFLRTNVGGWAIFLSFFRFARLRDLGPSALRPVPGQTVGGPRPDGQRQARPRPKRGAGHGRLALTWLGRVRVAQTGQVQVHLDTKCSF